MESLTLQRIRTLTAMIEAIGDLLNFVYTLSQRYFIAYRFYNTIRRKHIALKQKSSNVYDQASLLYN